MINPGLFDALLIPWVISLILCKTSPWKKPYKIDALAHVKYKKFLDFKGIGAENAVPN